MKTQWQNNQSIQTECDCAR